jgi:RhtB (resistance to homoserine/threonine) family protein
MTWSSYSGYLIVAVLMVLAPGPDTVVMLRQTLLHGRRGGALALLGILLGNLVQGNAAAFGLALLITRSRPLFEALHWAGVGYLLWLAARTLRAAWRGDYAATAAAAAARPGRGLRSFREGALSNLTNPKILVLYLSILPQFLVPGVTTTWQAVLLASTVGVLGALWMLVMLATVHRIREWLGRRRVRRALDAVVGTALAGFGLALASE